MKRETPGNGPRASDLQLAGEGGNPSRNPCNSQPMTSADWERYLSQEPPLPEERGAGEPT
jgi:hypothetical protein